MSARLVAHRYAKALLDLGVAQGNLPALQQELAAIDALVRGNGDLERLVSAPLVGPSKKAAAFDAVLAQAKATEQVRRFFRVVAESARLYLLHEIVEAFAEFVDIHMGNLEATVGSAHPLTPAQSQALVSTLSARTGKSVRLRWKQDPSLLGGLKVQLGSTIYDASLQGQLRLLKNRLLSA